MSFFLLGAIGMGFGVAGLFFLLFWRETRDRVFAFFALAFFVLAANRLGFALWVQTQQLGKGDVKERFYLANGRWQAAGCGTHQPPATGRSPISTSTARLATILTIP
jgi:hypothetical protein